MKEFGKIIAVNGDKVDIKIQRHAACGECGACHVGKNQMEMILTSENSIGAQVGDEVELNIETVDFLSAVLIMYGIPLISLVLGILSGYYMLIAIGISEGMAQGIAALIGLFLMGISYAVIKSKEPLIKGMKKYSPVIISIRNNNTYR